MPLLEPDEPHPVKTQPRQGRFLILCDHAGNRLPRALGTLGLSPADLTRHIAWDIGAGAVSRQLGRALGATVIEQVYSRLAIDCNRAPGHETSIPRRSEATDIDGNMALTPEQRAQRLELFTPYHEAIRAELDRRAAANEPAIVVAMHSFTPVYLGEARPWQAGVLFNRDPRLALALAEGMRAEGLLVGENEPYALGDDSDYTIPVHAEARGLPYVELEIRQDLIADAAGQAEWAARLARLLGKEGRKARGSAPGPR